MGELITDKIEKYLQGLLENLGLELFDLQFRREGHGWVLRVFIDAKEGVTLDHCSDVSRQLGHYLDVEDFIDHPYHLEVSSPGLERPLRSLDEFQRFLGKKARVRLHDAVDGVKVYEGVIEDIIGERIQLQLADGGFIQFSFEQINKARLAI